LEQITEECEEISKEHLKQERYGRKKRKTDWVYRSLQFNEALGAYALPVTWEQFDLDVSAGRYDEQFAARAAQYLFGRLSNVHYGEWLEKAASNAV